MSEGRHGWLTGWGTLISGIATIGLAVVAYLAYAHPRGNPGQQSFSVPANGGSGSSKETNGTGKHSREASLDFEMKKCHVGSKLVSCSLTVVSPRYDRRLIIAQYGSRLIDNEGDNFQMTSGMVNMTLERDQKLAFKLAFPVNKDVVCPLTVKMIGWIDNEQLDKGFEIR